MTLCIVHGEGADMTFADQLRQHFSATQIAEAVQFVTAPRTP